MRIALVGIRGYGEVHLRRIAPWLADGSVELVGVADPVGRSENVPESTPWYADLGALLAEQQPQLTIIATPIPTHAPLTRLAMAAGSHVYLEKPPATSLVEFRELLAMTADAGLTCQVGFQSLGSAAIGRVAELIADGAIGEVTAIFAAGLWSRTNRYYNRAAWAGQRTVNGVRTADGVATNPLAHSIATALRLAGITREEHVASVTTELYKAHPIDCDDTAFVQLIPSHNDPQRQLPVSAALTVCAAPPGPAVPDALPEGAPVVSVVGTAGRLDLAYTLDLLQITDADGTRREQLDRIDLVRNQLDHIADPSVRLLAPLVDTGAFMTALEAIQVAPEPTPLTGEAVVWHGTDEDAYPVIDRIDHWVAEAANAGRPFSAVGAPWATAEAVAQWDAAEVEETSAVGDQS